MQWLIHVTMFFFCFQFDPLPPWRVETGGHYNPTSIKCSLFQCSSINARDRVSYPHSRTGIIIPMSQSLCRVIWKENVSRKLWISRTRGSWTRFVTLIFESYSTYYFPVRKWPIRKFMHYTESIFINIHRFSYELHENRAIFCGLKTELSPLRQWEVSRPVFDHSFLVSSTWTRVHTIRLPSDIMSPVLFRLEISKNVLLLNLNMLAFWNQKLRCDRHICQCN
jgi:hypothetical protein